MPLSSAAFARSFFQKEKKTEVVVPNYSVLFFYGNKTDWVNTPSGTLDFNYYSSLITKTQLFGIPANKFQYPFYKCLDDLTDFTNVGNYSTLSVVDNLTSFATLLDVGGSHNPLSPGFRTSVPLAFAFNTGDVQSTVATDTFISQTGGHAGHTHRVPGLDIKFSIENTKINGQKRSSSATVSPNCYDSLSVPQIALHPVMRDPILGNPDTFLTSLPKNIVVLGANLPSPDYTRTDTIHLSRSSASRTVVDGTGNFNDLNTNFYSNSYIMSAHSLNLGTYFFNNLDFSVQSNNSPNHNHNVYPPTATKKSNKTGQTASILSDAGSHSHVVKYDSNISLKVKKLKAYLTTSDTTPIANGVIIGYLPSSQFGFSGDPASLPDHWHLCDGNNGTPDLQSYYIAANFNDSDHDVDISDVPNVIKINDITVVSNGAHSHTSSSAIPPVVTTIGSGTPKDIGSHNYETNANHTHNISGAQTFIVQGAGPQVNFVKNATVNILPPTLNIAFIMYNENIA